MKDNMIGLKGETIKRRPWGNLERRDNKRRPWGNLERRDNIKDNMIGLE